MANLCHLSLAIRTIVQVTTTSRNTIRIYKKDNCITIIIPNICQISIVLAPELKGIRYKLSAAVNNGTVWVDRNYKFSNLPDYLEGTLLFQIPHKAIRQGTVTEILVHQPSTLYLVGSIY